MNPLKKAIEENLEGFEDKFKDYTIEYETDPNPLKGNDPIEDGFNDIAGYLTSSQHHLLDVLAEQIEGMERDGKEKCSCDYELCGCRIVSYDQALSDVIALIKEAK